MRSITLLIIHGLLYFWLPASYSKSLIVPVSEEKLMPTLNSLRLSAAYGKAYPLSSICLRATRPFQCAPPR